MENLIEVKNMGSVRTYQVTHASKTVRELLHDLKLEQNFFAILVNGKKADLDQVIAEGSEITILPKIAGGH